MSYTLATVSEVEYPVVATCVSLPNPQNYAPTLITGQADQIEAINVFHTAHLNLVAEINKGIADLFCNYFQGCTNSSFAVTYNAVQLPLQRSVPARNTPFGHLNFLSSPVEGLYFDPDDVVEG
jgi:hypothetical protein